MTPPSPTTSGADPSEAPRPLTDDDVIPWTAPDASQPPAVTGICHDCSYALRALPAGRCPECGRPFDPADRRTMNMGLPLRPWQRRILKQPGRFTIGTVIALCLWTLFEFATPAPYYLFGHVFLLLLLFVLLTSVWGVRVGLRAFVARTRRQPCPPVVTSGQWLIWAFVVTAMLAEFRVPLYAGFILARPALARMVQEIGDAPNPKFTTDRWAGPYRIDGKNIRRYGHQIAFILADDAESAFVYSTDGVLSYNTGTDGHFWGRWYWWKED